MRSIWNLLNMHKYISWRNSPFFHLVWKWSSEGIKCTAIISTFPTISICFSPSSSLTFAIINIFNITTTSITNALTIIKNLTETRKFLMLRCLNAHINWTSHGKIKSQLSTYKYYIRKSSIIWLYFTDVNPQILNCY